MNDSRGIQVAVFNLVVVGIIGCFLRYYFVHPVSGVNYSYVLHAHSHLAFLGWVFMALYVLLVHAYLSPDSFKSRKYTSLFVVLQLANLGMLATFPTMGYALWSIVFSALHAFAAMYFAWTFIRDVQARVLLKYQMSFQMVKWALILMILSNVAPFALGPVSATQGKGDLYYLLIYFYLHFQYNGWFTFALLGLIVWLLEVHRVNSNVKILKVGFYLKLGAVVPAYVLSALWIEPDPFWYVVGAVSGVAQLLGLVFIGYFLIQNSNSLGLGKSFVLNLLFWVGLLAIVVQHVLMLLSSIPSLADLAFARNIVIAYLHLVLIGFVSVWLFLLLLKLGLIQLNISSKVGALLFLSAFIVTELVLVFQAYVVSATSWLLVLALMQLTGIVCFAFNAKRFDHAEGTNY